MKKILKISLATLCSAALLSSCIKEFEPTDRALSDQVTAQSLIMGIPAALVDVGSLGYSSSSHWDFSLPAVMIGLESMTGDLVILGNTGYDHFAQFGENNALGERYAIAALTWNNYYKWIMTTNKTIGLIDENVATDNERTYLGYAYAYRAMFYLDLTRMYECKENNYVPTPDAIKGLGVPIVLPETTEAEAKKNPRAKISDIFDQVIIPDLDKAEELLAGSAAQDVYNISLPVVYGLKARAYLYLGTTFNDTAASAKAAEYARKAITASGCKPLTQEQWESPTTGFNSATANDAWIWALSQPSETVSNLLNYTSMLGGECTWGYGGPCARGLNLQVYNSISDRDWRKHSWIDPEYEKYYDYKLNFKPTDTRNTLRSLKPYVNIKFRPGQGNYEDSKVGGTTDICLMRVEEMYFIEAEATARAQTVQAGAELLNQFMQTYRYPEYTCESYAGDLKTFVGELIFQKRIEFWGEGIVYYDMKRAGISTKRGYPGTNAPETYRLNCEGPAPYWNLVATRAEPMNNLAFVNNPDPSGLVKPWSE